jgi:hypothetical protein
VTKAAQPIPGSVSRITRIGGSRCLRLVEPGCTARGPASRYPAATYSVQIIGEHGDLLDEVQTESWVRAVEVFDSFAADAASPL